MVEFFRKYILQNWGLKVLSFGIAILMWWAVAHDPTVEIPMNIPVEFHHVPDNLVMSSESALQVQVVLIGPERTVRAMTPNEVHALIDLAGATPGERTFDLTPRQIHVPRDVEVGQIVPSQFHISFDRTASRTVDVRPRVMGSLITGYSITGVASNPPQITIEGPEKRVNAIDTAITDPVDATGVVGQATFTTHAYVPDPLVRVQRPQPIHVTVTTARVSRGLGQP
jgi:YbbR domain-containing protein